MSRPVKQPQEKFFFHKTTYVETIYLGAILLLFPFFLYIYFFYYYDSKAGKGAVYNNVCLQLPSHFSDFFPARKYEKLEQRRQGEMGDKWNEPKCDKNGGEMPFTREQLAYWPFCLLTFTI